MKALVTGGSGFIGGHLVDALVSNGQNVRVLVRKTSNINHLRGKGIELAYGDLMDKNSLKRAVNDVEIVYHLAASLNPSLDEITYKVNVIGTKNLLDECINRNIKKFIYCSSIAALGLSSEKTILDENSPCNSTTTYGKSKYEAERLILRLFYKKNFPGVIIRPSLVYGPGDNPWSISSKLFQTIHKGFFPIIGSGNSLISLCYVENLIQGLILAEEKENSEGGTYFISDPRPYTINEIVSTIAREEGVEIFRLHIPAWLANVAGFSLEILGKTFGFKPPLSRNIVKAMINGLVCNISKARKELGYEPKIDLKEGVKRTIGWYKENKLLN